MPRLCPVPFSAVPPATVDDAAEPLLEIRDLSVEYALRRGRLEAVRGLSLTLAPGESFGLVGESGCGKSSVAMALMGHLGSAGRVSSGRIRLDGRDLVGLSPAELRGIRGSRVAMVYQEPMSALNPSLTIGRQLTEVLVHKKGLGAAEARQRSVAALAEVRIPDPARMLARYPHQLSGGQQQRVVIAMALLADPALLILDEPTTALDVTVQAAFTELLVELRRKYRTAMIYISHNLGVVAQVCDRIGVMYLGEMVESGTVRQVFGRPLHPYTRGLLDSIPRADLPPAGRLRGIPGQAALPPGHREGCRFAPRCAFHVAETCSAADIPLLPSDDAGHAVRCARWSVAGAPERPGAGRIVRLEPPGAPILELDAVSKTYGGARRAGLLARMARRPPVIVKANDDVSFAVARGETVAIIGESGCGKSTLARMILGLLVPSAGHIGFRGRDLAAQPVDARDGATIADLQMVFQNPDATLNPAHTVGYALWRAVRRLNRGLSRREAAARVTDLLRLVELPDDIRHRRPDQLSGGQKQRVAIARALAGNPALVVADEPVSALDVSVQAAILNLFRRIQAERGTALLLISHDLGVVRSVADRLVVMYLGRIVEAGTVEEVFTPPHHPYTAALLAASPTLGSAPVSTLPGDPPSPIDPPRGCLFSPRCPRSLGPLCAERPPPTRHAGPGHTIRCHLDLAEMGSPALAAMRPQSRRSLSDAER